MSLDINKLKIRANSEIKNDEDLIILTLASGVLAAFGILLSNIFILIGAMLVSPFFDPIISLGLFMISNDWKGARKALYSIMFISVTALLASSVVYMVAGLWLDYDTTISFDIGFEYFIVAFILGCVGALLWLWPKTPQTSAGVSIAISLVPPLANISRGFFLMDPTIVLSSSILFLLNVVGIILGVLFVFKIKTDH